MDYKYISIDEENLEKGGHWWPWKREIISAILIAALSSIATFGIISLLSVKIPESDQFTCGKTFAEAHQRGCIFDPLTLTWLPPECSQHGQQEFLEASGNGTWHYWEDPDGLLELGTYEALSHLSPGTHYYTTQEQHLNHCMWMLLRVHDALTHGKRLSTRTISYEHSKHCLGMLVEEAKIGVGEKLTQVNVKGTAPDVGFSVC